MDTSVSNIKSITIIRAISVLSMAAFPVSTSLQVMSISASTFFVSLVIFCISAGAFLGMLSGGYYSDRFESKRVIFCGRVVTLILFTLMFLNCQLDRPSVAVICVLSFLASFSGAVSVTAFQALIPRVVTRERLRSVNWLNVMIVRLGMIISPLLVGVIIGYFSFSGGYFFIALSLACSLIFLHRIDAPIIKYSKKGFIGSLVEGFNYCRSNITLLLIMITGSVLNVSLSIRVLYPAIIVHFQSAQNLGYLYSAIPIGSALGAALCYVFKSGLNISLRGVVSFHMFSLLPFLLISIISDLNNMLMVLLLLGFFNSIAQFLQFSYIQENISRELTGRINSFYMSATFAIEAVATLTIGVLAASVGLFHVIVIIYTFLLVFSLVMFLLSLYKGSRNSRSP